MRQNEAVIKVMEDNGGFATLGLLYQEALRVEGCEWKTKTPFASIRRIVQDKKSFFKIRPGLWALKKYKNSLPEHILPTDNLPANRRNELSHSYFQGLLVEIGNLKNLNTFVPYQDKNREFLGQRLGEIITVKDFYLFTYDHIVQRAKTIDVSWFNSRKMPQALFEIEHSTDFQNSLLKFNEMQDFNVGLYIVADKAREREYHSKLSQSAFSSIQKRVGFLSYDKISEWHSRQSEYTNFEKGL